MLFVEDILEAFNRWKFRETLPDDAHKKVSVSLFSFFFFCHVKLTQAPIHKQDFTHGQEPPARVECQLGY